MVHKILHLLVAPVDEVSEVQRIKVNLPGDFSPCLFPKQFFTIFTTAGWIKRTFLVRSIIGVVKIETVEVKVVQPFNEIFR